MLEIRPGTGELRGIIKLRVMNKVYKALTVLLLIGLVAATGSFVIAALPVKSRMPDAPAARTTELVNMVNSRPVIIYSR